jgi:hypothetical protein
MRTAVLLVITCLAVAAACSKASDESEAKRSPVAPPPEEVEIPAGLSIPVEVDGAPGQPITAARLEALTPDFHDEDRRAWRLTRVLGDAFAADTVVEAVGPENVSITMRRPETDGEPQPVLFLTRRGDVVVAVVDPNRPFPGYHGQGGRLKRPGDPRPRLSPVQRLRVFVPPTGNGTN